MMTWIAVALGGALGAMSRYGVGQLMPHSTFPLATLTVNVVGSAIIGGLYARLIEQGGGSLAYAMLAVGFLGAFTTFSSFSLDTVRLIENGHALLGLTNVVLNTTLCLAAAVGGLWLAR